MVNDCKWAKNCCYDVCAPDYCPEYEESVLTNADRIRAMSDAELAEYLVYHNPYHTEDNCLKWLQKPAEVE